MGIDSNTPPLFWKLILLKANMDRNTVTFTLPLLEHRLWTPSERHMEKDGGEVQRVRGTDGQIDKRELNMKKQGVWLLPFHMVSKEVFYPSV